MSLAELVILSVTVPRARWPATTRPRPHQEYQPLGRPPGPPPARA